MKKEKGKLKKYHCNYCGNEFLRPESFHSGKNTFPPPR